MTAALSGWHVRMFAFSSGVLIAAACGNALAQQEWPVKATKEHKLLQKDVGTWDATMKIWHTPDAKPMESKATEKNELLPGGMWLLSRFEGKIGDMTFTGAGTYGYDPVEKKYVGTWIDTLTPHLMTIKGEYDDEEKVMTSMGEGRDAITGKPTKIKMITRYTDDDTRTFEMHMPGEDGEYWKMMEISYKRSDK